MNIYNVLGISLALFLYVYLIVELRSDRAEQNLATWILWVLLDSEAGLSMYAEKGNWYLLLVYVLGGSTIVGYIFNSAKFHWRWTENICSLLVVISLIAWVRFGADWATIISTFGVVIATYPQIKDAILEPEKTPAEVYFGFAIVCALVTAAGKDWGVNERFYSASCTLLCLGIGLLALRKHLPTKPPREQ